MTNNQEPQHVFEGDLVWLQLESWGLGKYWQKFEGKNVIHSTTS